MNFNILGRPLISLLHPTARVAPSEAFPRGWRNAHDAWLSRADHPERIEYVLTVHKSRWDAWAAEESRCARLEDSSSPWRKMSGLPGPAGWMEFQAVQNDKRDCVVDQTNLAGECSRGLVLMGVQDDYYPPEHWDTLVLEAFAGCPVEEITESDEWLSRPILLHCSTGCDVDQERRLMISGACTRPLYEYYGYCLDPDFESMFSDDWQAFQVKRDAAAGIVQIIERLDLIFEHRHPIFGKGQMDDIYALQNRHDAYVSGSVILQQKMSGSAVMVACLPGETFRSELVGSRFQLIENIKARTRFGIVSPHWCHTTNVYHTRIELAKAALSFPSCTKDSDLVLSADDDNPLEFDQLQILMQDLEENPQLAGVVAWCWCDHNETSDPEAKSWVMSCGRQDMTDLACMRFTGADFDKAIENGSCLISSDDIAPNAFWSGLPVLLIRRRALELMGWRSFIARSADPHLMAALKIARDRLTGTALEVVSAALAWGEVLDNTAMGMTSEDTSFFIRAHELGLKFAVDIRVRVQHVKWRGIQPQYIPESERLQVERLKAGF